MHRAGLLPETSAVLLCHPGCLTPCKGGARLCSPCSHSSLSVCVGSDSSDWWTMCVAGLREARYLHRAHACWWPASLRRPDELTVTFHLVCRAPQLASSAKTLGGGCIAAGGKVWKTACMALCPPCALPLLVRFVSARRPHRLPLLACCRRRRPRQACSRQRLSQPPRRGAHPGRQAAALQHQWRGPEAHAGKPLPAALRLSSLFP